MRFATPSARRQWLGEQLRSVVARAQATGQLARVLLWGSFVTSKEVPNDLEVFLVMGTECAVEAFPAPAQVVFDHVQARLRCQADVLWTTASIAPQVLHLWLDTSQTGKDCTRRGADHTAWTPVCAALERHFSVYTVDRRGRGHSGDAPAYALARECEDIAAVIDAIGGAVHVLGLSFGGLCALEAALLTPHVHRLILYEPPIPLGRRDGSAVFTARLQALLDAGNPEEALLLFLRDIVKIPSQAIAAVQARPTWPERVATAHTIPRELQSLDGYTFNPLRFQHMRTPTLHLLGGKSPAHRKAVAEMLHTALPNSQIVVLPGQKLQAMQTAPDLFVQAVVTFLTAAPAC